MNGKNLALAVQLRHELHEHPELSTQEAWTKKRLIDFLKEHTDLEIVDKGLWFYAIYKAGEGKKKIAFRADFDAIPVQETTNVPYKSKIPGVGHNCGHDGHSATLAMFALDVCEQKPDVNVYFLFQHAEEISQGAVFCQEMIKDEKIDEIYGYHNRPGVPFGAVQVRNGTMNCASKGMIIHMVGASAHASMPETGKNPSLAIAEIIKAIPGFIDPAQHKGVVLCTVICVDIGEEAFGVSAHEGKLMLTIRGEYEAEMDALQEKLEALAKSEAKKYGLTVDFSFKDAFPETANKPWGADRVRNVCKSLGIPVLERPEPNRGSEDYGYYLKLIPGAYFNVGCGENHPQIHTSGFDFDDKLMPVVSKIFMELLR